MIRKHIQLSETIVVYAFVCFASILYFLSNAQPNLYGIDENIFESIDISISHCKEYAIAYVVALS